MVQSGAASSISGGRGVLMYCQTSVIHPEWVSYHLRSTLASMVHDGESIGMKSALGCAFVGVLLLKGSCRMAGSYWGYSEKAIIASSEWGAQEQLHCTGIRIRQTPWDMQDMHIDMNDIHKACSFGKLFWVSKIQKHYCKFNVVLEMVQAVDHRVGTQWAASSKCQVVKWVQGAKNVEVQVDLAGLFMQGQQGTLAHGTNPIFLNDTKTCHLATVQPLLDCGPC